MCGLSRFEGINPKFTKKLYEWESRKGIAPDRSTITLLQTGLRDKESNTGLVPGTQTDKQQTASLQNVDLGKY